MSDFAYQLKLSKRRRTVQLAVRNGEVIVRAPTGICRQWLGSWLAEKQHWIKRALADFGLEQEFCWLSRQTILLEGEPVSFRWQLACKSSVEQTEQGLLLYLSQRIATERYAFYIKKLIREHLTALAYQQFPSLVAECALRMQLTPQSIIIGDWRSRWGHCKKQGELGFNWRLMQAPLWVRRYVVVHELAHLRYMNHSPAFWHLVAQYEPTYPQARAWLKIHQRQLLA